MPNAFARPLGIAVIAFATLVHQLLLVRFVSARLLNNYAFLIVSLSMAGFAIGGLVLSLAGKRIVARGQPAIGSMFDAYVLSLLLAWVTFGNMAVPTSSVQLQGYASPAMFVLSVVLCVPFIFSGMAVGTYLSSPEKTGRLYAFDLGAASFGCVVSIALVPVLGLERLTALTCLFVVAVRLVLSRPQALADGVLFALAAIVATAATYAPLRVLSIAPIENSMLSVVTKNGGRIVDARWDPAARIEVAEAPPGLIPEMFKDFPSLLSEDPALLAEYVSFLTQNNYAFTMMVDREAPAESFAGVRNTLYSAAYVALSLRRQDPKAAAIGVGGGSDILTALVNGAREVTGVEVNGATLSILRDRYGEKPGHFLNDPRVKLVHADGRHFIASSEEKYDVIQLSGVDSYSGSQGSAHVFSETYLYTLEAMVAYLEHMTDDGVMNIMRLEHSPPVEMLRVLTTMVAALREIGVENPAAHILCVGQTGGSFIAALVSKTPFTREEVAHVQAWADGIPSITMTATPFDEGPIRNNHDIFLRRARTHDELSTYDEYVYSVAPATDDWPFFFQFGRWSHVLSWIAGERIVFRPTLQLAVLTLAVILSLLMLVTVIVPLWVFSRRGLQIEHPAAHVLFFALLGLGFLIVEVHLMQRLALLLGGQTMSVTIVLMTLLLSSGIGAATMSRVFARLKHPRYVAYLFCSVALVLPLLDGVLYDAIALSLPVRVGIAVAITAPLGYLMGVWFPLGLDHLKASSPDFVPWAWGVNGAFSVLAPILTIAVAVTVGQTMSYLLAIPIYLVAGLIADRLGMSRTSIRAV